MREKGSLFLHWPQAPSSTVPVWGPVGALMGLALPMEMAPTPALRQTLEPRGQVTQGSCLCLRVSVCVIVFASMQKVQPAFPGSPAWRHRPAGSGPSPATEGPTLRGWRARPGLLLLLILQSAPCPLPQTPPVSWDLSLLGTAPSPASGPLAAGLQRNHVPSNAFRNSAALGPSRQRNFLFYGQTTAARLASLRGVSMEGNTLGFLWFIPNISKGGNIAFYPAPFPMGFM